MVIWLTPPPPQLSTWFMNDPLSQSNVRDDRITNSRELVNKIFFNLGLSIFVGILIKLMIRYKVTRPMCNMHTLQGVPSQSVIYSKQVG